MITFQGDWKPTQEQWVRTLIGQIPSFLRTHPSLFVGDVDATQLGLSEGYMCFVSKHDHSQPFTLQKAYFQPYPLRDRDPVCRIEVDYEADTLDQATYRVYPMCISVLDTE